MMRMRRNLPVALMALLVHGCAETGATRSNESIEIKDAGESYSLSVPVSRLTMTLPKGNWSRVVKSTGGSTDNPRYFYFEDKKEASLILSGWFEPDRLFTGTRDLWEKDTQSWKKRGLPEPGNVAFERVGRWDTVMYDHPFGKAVNSHIRAHWVQSGTWIDLHISTTTFKSSAENRRKLRSVLGGISISERGASAPR